MLARPHTTDGAQPRMTITALKAWMWIPNDGLGILASVRRTEETFRPKRTFTKKRFCLSAAKEWVAGWMTLKYEACLERPGLKIEC